VLKPGPEVLLENGALRRIYGMPASQENRPKVQLFRFDTPSRKFPGGNRLVIVTPLPRADFFMSLIAVVPQELFLEIVL
jgi:hypothetical protein